MALWMRATPQKTIPTKHIPSSLRKEQPDDLIMGYMDFSCFPILAIYFLKRPHLICLIFLLDEETYVTHSDAQ